MLLLSLSSYGGLKFSLLHREKVSHTCLCTLDNIKVVLVSRERVGKSVWCWCSGSTSDA